MFIILGIADVSVYDSENNLLATGKTLLDSSIDVEVVKRKDFPCLYHSNIAKINVNDAVINENGFENGIDKVVISAYVYDDKELIDTIKISAYDGVVSLKGDRMFSVFCDPKMFYYDSKMFGSK